MINDQPVLVEYQGSAWMPGTTDAIYVSSVNGTTVTLDKKAMDKSYKEINLGITKSKKTKKIDDDSISKVTDVTKAASVPVVLTDKKNKKKFSNIKSSAKISKSSQVFDSAVAVKAG
jgi:ABC-type microcin C transport system permease subunit YejE